jgi:hypothetical protein
MKDGVGTNELAVETVDDQIPVKLGRKSCSCQPRIRDEEVYASRSAASCTASGLLSSGPCVSEAWRVSVSCRQSEYLDAETRPLGDRPLGDR